MTIVVLLRLRWVTTPLRTTSLGYDSSASSERFHLLLSSKSELCSTNDIRGPFVPGKCLTCDSSRNIHECPNAAVGCARLSHLGASQLFASGEHIDPNQGSGYPDIFLNNSERECYISHDVSVTQMSECLSPPELLGGWVCWGDPLFARALLRFISFLP